MRTKHGLWVGLFVFAAATSIFAQLERRVSVITIRDETIDGVFVSATPTDVIVRVAGQPIRVPFDSIALLSFERPRGDGDIRREFDVRRRFRHPMEAALSALQDLRLAIAAGMQQKQYTDMMQLTRPVVEDFSTSTQDWPDVRLALDWAVALYEKPLATATDWQKAPEYWEAAHRRVEYAEELARDERERTHRESSTSRPITIGNAVGGRLGTGDVVMTPGLDSSSAGGFNDIWELQVTMPTAIQVSMKSEFVRPHLTLVDGQGRKVEGDMAVSDRSTIRRTIPAGKYEIWAGASTRGEIGTYSLELRPR